MITPEFVAAEVEYRTQRLAADYRAGRRDRKARRTFRFPLTMSLHLPAMRKRAQRDSRPARCDWQSAG